MKARDVPDRKFIRVHNSDEVQSFINQDVYSSLSGKAFVEIIGADLGELFDLLFEEVIGSRDYLMFDDDAPLGLELRNKTVDRFGRGDRVFVAVDEQSGSRAGGEK